MFVNKAFARLTMFTGLMALQNAIPTAVYAQQGVMSSWQRLVVIGLTSFTGSCLHQALHPRG
jgi:hypothetical protein